MASKPDKDNKIADKFKRKKKKSVNAVSISHVRTESGKPSHHTMSSLALLAANNPTAMDELAKVSVDMRFQRELDRMQKTLKQKEEQFLSALEIADNLNIANTKLKNQCSGMEEQLSNLQNENQQLQTKLTTIENRYEKDMQQLQSSLEEHTQMVIQLQEDLMTKEKALQIAEQQQLAHLKDKFNNGETLTSLDGMEYGGMDAPQSSKNREQELRKQLEEEMRRSDDWLKERNQLYEKLDEMSKVNMMYEKLQEKFRQFQQASQDEISDYQEATKAISNEIVVLAAQNSRLEQRMEELQTDLRQRDHEIALLSQANVIQTRQLRHGTMASDQLQTRDLDELAGLTQASADNAYVLSQLDNDMDDELDAEEANSEFEEVQHEGGTDATKPEMEPKKSKKMNEKDKVEFVADVIKEYLHLSASSVKIKYPLVTSISNEVLIEQTKHLPFYQYHDFMVRIMEKEIKRMDEAKKKKQEEEERQRRKSQVEVTIQKPASRRSLLGNFFGLFGGKEDDKEETDDDDEETEFHQAKQLENDNNPSTKGHRSTKSGSYVLSPAPMTIQRDTNSNQPKGQNTHITKPTQTQTETSKQNNSSTTSATSSAPAKDEKHMETRKAASSTATNEENKNSNGNDNIEEILDDMDLDGILDDDELTKDNNVSAAPQNRTKRNQSTDRRGDDKTNKNELSQEDPQSKRSTRNVLSRALSRR